MDRRTVETILSEAHAAVQAADLPESLQVVAFEKAVDLLGGVSSSTPASATPSADNADRSGGNGRHDQVDAGSAEAFVRSQPNVERPAEAVKAIAAWWFSQYGSAPITRANVEQIAEEIGVTIPDRPDNTMKGMKHDGRDVFRSAGRGALVPIRPHGELFFQTQYSVTKGRKPAPTGDDAS